MTNYVQPDVIQYLYNYVIYRFLVEFGYCLFGSGHKYVSNLSVCDDVCLNISCELRDSHLIFKLQAGHLGQQNISGWPLVQLKFSCSQRLPMICPVLRNDQSYGIARSIISYIK